MLYTVYYPNSRSCDKDVGDRFLDRLARDAATDKSLIGAVAIAETGGRQTLVLEHHADGPRWEDK